MSRSSATDFPAWIKSTDKRVQALERRGAIFGSGGGGGGDGGSIAPEARQVTSVITGTLANNGTEYGNVNLALAYRIYALVADRACRVRFYTTSALRLADADRDPGEDPVYEHGVMGDFVFTGPGQLTAAPMIDGFVPSGISVPYAIQNLSGGSSTVRVDFTWIRTEGLVMAGSADPLALGYTFNQSAPATDWYIAHALDFVPSVVVVDSAGTVVVGDINYVSSTLIHLHFSAAFSGVAYLS